MNTHSLMLCLLAGAGLFLSEALGATEPPFNAAESIRSQGKQALATIQADQYQDLLARTQRQLMPSRAIIVPTPWAHVEVRIRLQGRLARLAIQEQLMAEYQTGAAARQLATLHYRNRIMAAAQGEPQPSTLDTAKVLFKSAKFEWPEFMPRGLR